MITTCGGLVTLQIQCQCGNGYLEWVVSHNIAEKSRPARRPMLSTGKRAQKCRAYNMQRVIHGPHDKCQEPCATRAHLKAPEHRCQHPCTKGIHHGGPHRCNDCLPVGIRTEVGPAEDCLYYCNNGAGHGFVCGQPCYKGNQHQGPHRCWGCYLWHHKSMNLPCRISAKECRMILSAWKSLIGPEEAF